MGRHRSITILRIRQKLARENSATKNNNTPAVAPGAPVTLMARAICNATDFIRAPPFTKRRKGLELHLGNDLLLGRGKGTRLVGRHLALQQGESQEQYWNNMELSQQNESVRFVQRLILRLQVAATLRVMASRLIL
jgi:hypothetical protein